MKYEEWEFEDDRLYKYTPAPELGEDICHREMMMTKEVFRECFRRWMILEDKKYEHGRCNERV